MILTFYFISSLIFSSCFSSPSSYCPNGCVCSNKKKHSAECVIDNTTQLIHCLTSWTELEILLNNIMPNQFVFLENCLTIGRVKVQLMPEVDRVPSNIFIGLNSTKQLVIEPLSASTTTMESQRQQQQQQVSLTILDDHLLKYFPSLTLVNIQRLSLKNQLSPEVFSFCPISTNLDLSNNQLTLLQANSFVNCLQVKYLTLSHNKLTRLTNFTFNGLKLIQRIRLEGNEIIEISPNSWKNCCSELRELDLTNNQLNQLVCNQFEELIKLKLLKLGNNKLQNDICGKSLNNLINLETIILSKNGISQLPNDLFQYAIQLKLLDLSNNHLTNLSHGIFSNLLQLQILDLRGNVPLKKIDGNILIPLRSLTTLHSNADLCVEMNKLQGSDSLKIKILPCAIVDNFDGNGKNNVMKLPLNMDNRILNENDGNGNGNNNNNNMQSLATKSDGDLPQSITITVASFIWFLVITLIAMIMSALLTVLVMVFYNRHVRRRQIPITIRQDDVLVGTQLM